MRLNPQDRVPFGGPRCIYPLGVLHLCVIRWLFFVHDPSSIPSSVVWVSHNGALVVVCRVPLLGWVSVSGQLLLYLCTWLVILCTQPYNSSFSPYYTQCVFYVLPLVYAALIDIQVYSFLYMCVAPLPTHCFHSLTPRCFPD